LNGKVPVCEVLKRLATEKNVMHLVCEGGAGIAGALLDEDLVDECYFFYAPVLSGDEQARSAICGKGFELAQMPRFKIVKVRKYGDDVMVQALRDRQLKLEES
jgi:diaminohydroxyphosphoribosylaminopyrimidine deaminase/5-amino-6-(5-phosphoribosylamino)uracil reductase